MKFNETWREDMKTVKDGIHAHFKEHFNKVLDSRPILSQNLFHCRISTTDENFLTTPFSELEVKHATENCDNFKSTMSDGFNFKFVKECLHIIKDDFLRMLEDFHLNGNLVRGLNTSFIVLIPKKKNVEGLSDYRSISLINYSYKILAKILAIRLNQVLDEIISKN